MLWRIPTDLRRERIGMMFINIDASRVAAAIVVGRLHDALRLQSARPWLPNDRRKGRKGRKPLSRAPIAVRKNSRSPRPAPAQYRVVFLQIGPIP
jgi:hypothetical protein